MVGEVTRDRQFPSVESRVSQAGDTVFRRNFQRDEVSSGAANDHLGIIDSQENAPDLNGGLRPLKDARDAFERDYLIQVLSMTEGNVSQAAKLAGKYRADFYDLLKKHDLKAHEFKKSKPLLPN